MPQTKVKCVCLGIENTENHHLFRRGIRKKWIKLGISKIKIYWQREDGKEVSTSIPIKAYAKICDICHKLNHPENISYHLNEMVVHNTEKEK